MSNRPPPNGTTAKPLLYAFHKLDANRPVAHFGAKKVGRSLLDRTLNNTRVCLWSTWAHTGWDSHWQLTGAVSPKVERDSQYQVRRKSCCIVHGTKEKNKKKQPQKKKRADWNRQVEQSKAKDKVSPVVDGRPRSNGKRYLDKLNAHRVHIDVR